MTYYHRFCTTDPISGKDLPDTRGLPYVVEGGGSGEPGEDLTIYFESDATRQAYLDIPLERPASELSINLDNLTEDVLQ